MTKDLIAENKKFKKKIKNLKCQLKIEKIRSKHLEIVNVVIMNRVKVTKEEKETVRKVLVEYLNDLKMSKE